MHAASTVTAEAALTMLKEGNERFVSGNVKHPNQSAARREEVLAGQHPFVALVSCADSRVAPEVFFDQGIGDLFIMRNAGNILDDVVLGSLEYGVEHLGIPLIMVLGHTKCGAVTATVQTAQSGGSVPGHIASIVQTIMPAALAVKGQAGDAVYNATVKNVQMSVEAIKHSKPILAEMVEAGKVKVVGGIYDLATGKVEMV